MSDKGVSPEYPTTTVDIEFEGLPTGRSITLPFSEEELDAIHSVRIATERLGFIADSGSGIIRELVAEYPIPIYGALRDREKGLEEMKDSLARWYVKGWLQKYTSYENQDWLLIREVLDEQKKLIGFILDGKEFVEEVLAVFKETFDHLSGKHESAAVTFLGSAQAYCEWILGQEDAIPADREVAGILPLMYEAQIASAKSDLYFYERGLEMQANRREIEMMHSEDN